MKWGEWMLVTNLVTNGLLFIFYAVVGWHVWFGTRYKMVLWLIAMLMLANVLYEVSGLGTYGVIVAIKNEDFGKQYLEWQCVAGLGNSLGDLLFSEAHWLLAFFYYKMARNMPRVVQGGERLETYKALLWIGIVLNAVFPIMEGTSWILFDVKLVKGTPLWWLYKLLNASLCSVWTLWIISGTFLIWSVFKIRKFFMSRNEDGSEINLKTLVLHSMTFCLFLASVLVLTATVVIYMIVALENGGEVPKRAVVAYYLG